MGFIPRQSSTAPASQTVDIPSSGGGFPGFLPRQGSAASAVENVDFPAGGGRHGLRPGQGFTAFSGLEHGHDAPRRSRRGGGSVGGPQGSVSGQLNSPRSLPGPRGCGFRESSAEAEFGDAAFGGFPVPVSWQEHFAANASVTFSVRTASWRLTTSRRRVGGEGLGIPSPLLGCHYWQSCSVSTCCLRRTVLDSSRSGYASVLCALLGLTADTVHV